MTGACGGETTCARYIANPVAWESPGIGRAIFFLVLQAVTFFLLVFFLESSYWKSIRQSLYSNTLGLVGYKMVGRSTPTRSGSLATRW